MYLALLISLAPPVFIFVHTLVGILLMPIYGVYRWRFREGCIEVLAKRREDGTSRIWFKPGAQTWGLVIFCANGYNYENSELQVHERVHVLQSYLFGILYPITYLLFFVMLYVIVLVRLDWWERNDYDDNVWHAYRMIPWERWAYKVQDRYRLSGDDETWGAFNDIRD